jgi:hypothetical protein
MTILAQQTTPLPSLHGARAHAKIGGVCITDTSFCRASGVGRIMLRAEKPWDLT